LLLLFYLAFVHTPILVFGLSLVAFRNELVQMGEIEQRLEHCFLLLLIWVAIVFTTFKVTLVLLLSERSSVHLLQILGSVLELLRLSFVEGVRIYVLFEQMLYHVGD